MSAAILKYVLGAGVSCALAFSFANPSNAFPALTNTATVKSSMPSLVTDAILGGLLAAPYYYRGGQYYYPDSGYYAYGSAPGSTVADCMRRFKSYDRRSGTYLGYDGYRHPCP
jgi:hypothetical protein